MVGLPLIWVNMLHSRNVTANKAVDKARNDMEADLYTKVDEDAGKKMIYKMARHRNEYHLSRTEIGS